MASLVPAYEPDSDGDDVNDEAETSTGYKPTLDADRLALQLAIPSVNAAPIVVSKNEITVVRTVEPGTKIVHHNPTYEELWAPVAGPSNPHKTQQQNAVKNTLSGYAEPASFNDAQFENERRTFHTLGYAKNPTVDQQKAPKSSFVGNKKAAEEAGGVSVFEGGVPAEQRKRKQVKNWDSTDLESYTGPWGKFEDEKTVAVPEGDVAKYMEEYLRKRKKMGRVTRSDNVEEKSVLHLRDHTDYQGRTFMHPPTDLPINLKSTEGPERCFVPKKQVHTYTGHTKGVQVIRWFPQTAHMLLSGSMDSKIKLWEVYKGRKIIRTYDGHRQAVRDINFNNDGTEFLSASFDRFIKLWDTETGKCKMRFHTGKIPFCVVYHPDDDKQHFFLSGMQDKKIIQWDTRNGEVVQEYDRHLGAVNTITFFDKNRRFCSTSDDKSLRIWEWEIPVDTKLIQDSGMHSMPAVRMSPNLKWLVCQSMDNRIVLFQLFDDKLRWAKKRAFKGHMVAGYACGMDFSSDMSPQMGVFYQSEVPVLWAREHALGSPGASTGARSGALLVTASTSASHAGAVEKLHIELESDTDPLFYRTLSLDAAAFDRIKQEQTLIVGFAAFPQMFQKLLDGCKDNADGGHRYQALVHVDDSCGECRLQIVETSQFKRLVHLSLTFAPVGDDDMKRHLAECVKSLQRQLSAARGQAASLEQSTSNTTSQLQSELLAKCQDYDKLKQWTSNEMKRLKEKCAQDVARAQQGGDEHIHDLEQQLQRLKDDLYKAHDECEHLRSTLSRRSDELSELRAAHEDLTERCERLSAADEQLRRVAERRDSLESDLRAGEQKYRRLLEQKKQLAANLEAQRVEFEKGMDVIRKLLQRNHGEHAKSESLGDALLKQETRIGELTQQRDQLQQQLDTANENLEQVKRDNESNERKLTETNEKLLLAEARVKKLENESASSSALCEHLNKQLNELRVASAVAPAPPREHLPAAFQNSRPPALRYPSNVYQQQQVQFSRPQSAAPAAQAAQSTALAPNAAGRPLIRPPPNSFPFRPLQQATGQVSAPLHTSTPNFAANAATTKTPPIGQPPLLTPILKKTR